MTEGNVTNSDSPVKNITRKHHRQQTDGPLSVLKPKEKNKPLHPWAFGVTAIIQGRNYPAGRPLTTCRV